MFLIPAQAAIQLLHFARQHQCFFLAQTQHCAVVAHRFEFFQARNRQFDGAEVGEHAAQPTVIHEGHATADGFGLHRITRRVLGTDEHDGAALRCDAADEIQRVVEHRQGFFQIDDMNFIAVSVNERSHFRVPEPGLMAEVATRFQHFTHSHSRHKYSSLG